MARATRAQVTRRVRTGSPRDEHDEGTRAHDLSSNSRDESFRERYGPVALVAGGSFGLGAEYARQLAERGLDLVVVAESADPLQERCREWARECGVAVRAVVQDLGEPDLLAQLGPQIDDLDVGLLVYNAAYSQVGLFLEQDLEAKLRTLDVNCRGALLLCHEYGRRMAERGRGGIVLMSSLSALQGTPLVATYAATKAFDLVLGEALWDELGRCGVDVLSVVGGAIRTPGFEKSAPAKSARFSPPVMEPEEVVNEALAALGFRPSVIAGRANRWSAGLLSRVLPRHRAVRAMARSMRSIYRAQARGSSKE